MPVPKNVTKRDAIAKKGMLSRLILSSLDSILTEKCKFFKNLHASMGAIGLYFSNLVLISSHGLLITD